MYALSTHLHGGALGNILFSDCRLLRWPDEHEKQPGKYSDVHDGQHWQSYILGDRHFCPNGQIGRNLTLIFCGDGVQPFKRINYSIWPLALACANLPGHLRMTLPATWLSCMIPAHGKSKGEPTDFQCFSEILVDELNYLYHVGTDVEDSTHRYDLRHSQSCPLCIAAWSTCLLFEVVFLRSLRSLRSLRFLRLCSCGIVNVVHLATSMHSHIYAVV